MGQSVADLIELVKELQRDGTRIKARLSELQRGLAALPATEEGHAGLKCPRCGLTFKLMQTLEEHLVNVHAEGRDPVAPPPPPATDEFELGAELEAKDADSKLDRLLPPAKPESGQS